MLVHRRRHGSWLHIGTNHGGEHLLRTSAHSSIAFVEGNEHQAIASCLEVASVQQWGNVVLEKVVSLLHGAVMGIIIHIGNDNRVVWKLIGGQVCCEFCERDHVLLQCRTVDHIGVPLCRIVTSHIVAGGAAHEAGARQGLCVNFPRQACSPECSEDIV